MAKQFGAIRQAPPPPTPRTREYEQQHAGHASTGITDAIRADVRKGLDARPFKGPSPDALEHGAWYLAGVVCFGSGHHIPAPSWPYEWPCKRCIGWATEQLHQLATTILPKEVSHEEADPKAPESSGKSKRGSSGERVQKSRGGRGQRERQPVRRGR